MDIPGNSTTVIGTSGSVSGIFSEKKPLAASSAQLSPLGQEKDRKEDIVDISALAELLTGRSSDLLYGLSDDTRSALFSSLKAGAISSTDMVKALEFYAKGAEQKAVQAAAGNSLSQTASASLDAIRSELEEMAGAAAKGGLPLDFMDKFSAAMGQYADRMKEMSASVSRSIQKGEIVPFTLDEAVAASRLKAAGPGDAVAREADALARQRV